MQIYYEDGQGCLFDPASFCGKTCREPSPPANPRARTFVSSLKRLSEYVYPAYMYLDLASGHTDLLGGYEWEILSPWDGASLMLNTGVCPREESASSLSRILEDKPRQKYYLSPKACLGILRRALERGKELPARLKAALMAQAGLRKKLDDPPAGVGAYHINQRSEGIDLNGVSGALMATQNMQMQTFVTVPDSKPMVAFAANQRDEVRELHDIAGALGAQPGMKQQTFVAGFSAGAGSSASGIGYGEECAPTLKGSESGNMMPSVLCVNDQGGQRMDMSENISGTLRAHEHGHQPIVYENHGQDSRYKDSCGVSPTISSKCGTGGNNTPLLEDEAPICVMGNAIDREPHNGGNGIGYQEDLAYTLTATDKHAVYSRQRVDVFREDDVASTESVRQHKDATDLVCDLSKPFAYLIRRLTPLECERLQGFPDGWTGIPGAADASRYKALGNSVAIPCVDYILHGVATALRAMYS